MKVSVAIPVYEMSGRGVECLEYNFKKIYKQTFKDFEVVVSDHSKDDKILLLCDNWNEKLDIKYVRNEENRGSLASNLNNCMKNCSGDIIKFIMEDDYLYCNESLKKIVNNFDMNKGWMVSSYFHTTDRIKLFNLHIPEISRDILFINRIGTPTCLTISNKQNIEFDQELNWYVDSDFYTQLYKTYGKPIILRDPTAVQLLWEGQTTNTLINDTIIKNEEIYLMKKYKAYRNDKN